MNYNYRTHLDWCTRASDYVTQSAVWRSLMECAAWKMVHWHHAFISTQSEACVSVSVNHAVHKTQTEFVFLEYSLSRGQRTAFQSLDLLYKGPLLHPACSGGSSWFFLCLLQSVLRRLWLWFSAVQIIVHWLFSGWKKITHIVLLCHKVMSAQPCLQQYVFNNLTWCFCVIYMVNIQWVLL